MMKFLNLSALRHRPAKAPAVPGGLRVALGTYRNSVQWRQDPAAVQSAVNIMASEPMREIIAILHNESPLRVAPLPPGSGEADIARAYGVEAGYLMCLHQLLSLAEPFPAPEREPTFSDI